MPTVLIRVIATEALPILAQQIAQHYRRNDISLADRLQASDCVEKVGAQYPNHCVRLKVIRPMNHWAKNGTERLALSNQSILINSEEIFLQSFSTESARSRRSAES